MIRAMRLWGGRAGAHVRPRRDDGLAIVLKVCRVQETLLSDLRISRGDMEVAFKTSLSLSKGGVARPALKESSRGV